MKHKKILHFFKKIILNLTKPVRFKFYNAGVTLQKEFELNTKNKKILKGGTMKMNNKQYNNVIEYTLKHEETARTEDSLGTAIGISEDKRVPDVIIRYSFIE